MTTQAFPVLDAYAIGSTLNAVHAYTQVLGDWLGSTCRDANTGGS